MKEVALEMVSSPGCQHCRVFRAFWEPLAKDWPNVKFTDWDVTTAHGQELAGKHMIFSSPGLIINGELFSTGGVNQQKFLSRIKELSQL